MKFTLAWLRDHLEFDSSVEVLCEKLTELGLEVENYKNPKSILDHFVISEVVEIKSHPNADKLKVCKVNNGKELINIVCGASNVHNRMKTVLAEVGCIIKPGTNEEFKIKKSVIRGVESCGMLCSEEELGLSDFSEGIINLKKNCKVGDKFSTYLNDDYIEIEIAITPNRVDCAGVHGIARDLSASGFGKLKKITPIKIDSSFESKIKLTNTLKSSSCPQFSLREISGVKNVNSPESLMVRLQRSGLKVISGLVDVTNYLTIDFCRPLHVFDRDKIKGEIKIRNSKNGEKFFGLDDKDYILDDGMIVICDEEKIISLAGIMGGKNTACDEKTKNVLLESAYFCPDKISWAGRNLNIVSDARYRFERGIDPKSTIIGMELATNMIIENCGGQVGSIVSDSVQCNKKLQISVEKIFFEKILGSFIDDSTIIEKLEKIGCNVEKLEKILNVTPPSWRPDIKIKEDLVEEVGRLVGYNKIPAKQFDTNNNKDESLISVSQKLKKKIRELLVSKNIMEIISWTFVNKKWESYLGAKKILELENPISSELSCLRSNLIGGLLNLISKNNNKNVNNISVFEIGPVFHGAKPGEQSDHLTIIRSGKASDKNWTLGNRNFDIYDLKSNILDVCKVFKLSENKLKIIIEKISYLHPGKSASFYLGETKIGNFGELHPSVTKAFKLKNNTYLCEVFISNVLKIYKDKGQVRNRFRASTFQASTRDFSFEVDIKLQSIDLVNLVKSVDKEIISDVKVFDNFENNNIRSIALEVVMQSEKKTLTDEEINNVSQKIVERAEVELNARLR